MAGRTTFIIAHRLSTIESSDKIMVMEGGEIIESGTHQELINNAGHYAYLNEIQFRDL
jgi:subfamily B ATP-binding cassette protein MsbA